MILVSLLVWRFYLYVVAYVTSIKLPFNPEFPYSDVYFLPTKLPQWLWGWANFDGVHYITIAKSGYSAQFTQAFFPIYPILLSIFSSVVRDSTIFIIAQLFSFVCLAISIFLFRKLLLLDYQKDVVSKSILALLVYPTSFYFAAVYTESFFFMLMIASFYFARQKKWWYSAFCAALASATRVTGIFLLPALLIEWWITYRQNIKASSSIWKKVRGIVSLIIKSPITYIAPLGLIFYMMYLQIKFADALYFFHAQSAFGASRQTSLVLPPQVIYRYIKILLSVPLFESSWVTAFSEIFSFIFAFYFLIVAYFKKVRLSYIFISFCTLLLPSLTGTFTSIPRYALLCFPIFIVLAQIKSKALFIFLMIISFLLLTLATSFFIQGRWVA